jgi:hypothetical protein
MAPRWGARVQQPGFYDIQLLPQLSGDLSKPSVNYLLDS